MKLLERTLNVVFVLAAVIMAASIAHREIASRNRPAARGPEPVYHQEWRQFLESGRLVSGHERSPVQIVEFLDLQCSACKYYQSTILAAIKGAYGDSVAVTVVHFPLQGHRYAVMAARASECAAQQGRFASFVDGALAKQDSFGIKPWSQFAIQAGVGDQRAFSRCLSQPSFPAIDAGSSLASRLGLSGTPSIIVNGWEFPRPPGEKTLRDEVEAIVAGKPRRPPS